MKSDLRESYLALSYFRKIGPTNWKCLEDYFPDLGVAFTASTLELERAGLRPKLAAEFYSWRRDWKPGAAAAELEKRQINFIHWADPLYPSWLKEIPAPPPLLYYIGKLDVTSSQNLAVVGSRRPSPYAKKILDDILPPIVKAGVMITSGLALGVDSLAHRLALANRGLTLAVLGSGLAKIYPPENYDLARKIVSGGGAIISEFPPHTPPLRQNFPRRNRIISGLSKGVLVIEAGAASGALITARYGLEQDRDILAIPGSIYSENSVGPNRLIRAGALAITCPDDLLEFFDLEAQNT